MRLGWIEDELCEGEIGVRAEAEPGGELDGPIDELVRQVRSDGDRLAARCLARKSAWNRAGGTSALAKVSFTPRQ